MQRNDVASTSFRRHVSTRLLINQCQIITFLILKSDIIENSRIELRGILLPAPSNQIKVTFIIILPFILVHLTFFRFHIYRIDGKSGWITVGGAKGMLPPSNYWGGGGCPLPSPPPPPPSSYAYHSGRDFKFMLFPISCMANAFVLKQQH